MDTLEQVVVYATGRKASDVHLALDENIYLRLDGDIVSCPGLTTGAPFFEDVYKRLSPAQHKAFKEQALAADFAVNCAGWDMRCHLYWANTKPILAVRFMRGKIPSMEDVMLPKAFQDLIRQGRPTGLILVTGYTGSGKSTTLAACLDWINHNSALNIVTLEHPVEYRYKAAQSIIRQREVGRDVPTFGHGMVDAMREDPDVILIGELRDPETVKAAVSAAETGHLVFGTLHTRTAGSTISRILDVLPSDERDQVRTMVASSLLAVIGQRLITRVGGGRVAAFELLLNCPAVAGAIRENKPGQIANEIAVKKDMGMIDFDTCLVDYVRKKLITPETAMESSDRPDEIRKRLGISTKVNPLSSGMGAGASSSSPMSGGTRSTIPSALMQR
ncbi:twitching motility protein PilT [Ereboglobus sp. PH5-10]|uniref:type IV pilus twitching motility protein PilT n=1 Tax=Ereboglobus sp. PH5-10 TaxID=2940629 RepID=UPI002404CD9D|nr:PilT/PilU family type 4a pilus ATPase [Ereboglobus sp. PH5-10]MDF9828348.1 twitching motility protein PilT [Ereboglobus sp. PH5-10]